MNYTIALVPGDGIGPDVVAQAVEVLDLVGDRFGHGFNYVELEAGGCAIDSSGEPLPAETLEAAKQCDAVLLGAVGVWLGYPLADPLVGLGITVAILVIVWQSAKAVFPRLLDGVEPEVIDEFRHAARHVTGVREVTEVRARWIGHRLHAEVNVAVAPDLPVAEGHAVAKEVRHQLLHHAPYLGEAIIHVDPVGEAGEGHHRIAAHAHDGLPVHSH